MNELIKEFINRATVVEYNETFNFETSRFDREKFAELIVRECGNIADKAEPYKANDLIKKHFGVEE